MYFGGEFYDFSWHCGIVNRNFYRAPLQRMLLELRWSETSAVAERLPTLLTGVCHKKGGYLNLRHNIETYVRGNKMPNIPICKLNAAPFGDTKGFPTRNWMPRVSWILMRQILQPFLACFTWNYSFVQSSVSPLHKTALFLGYYPNSIQTPKVVVHCRHRGLGNMLLN